MIGVPAEKTTEPGPGHPGFILKAFILCLSFANLSFLNVWTDLLSQPGFFQKYGVSSRQVAAVTLDVLLLAVVLWIPVCLVVNSGSRTMIRILKWCVFAGLMFPLNILRLTKEVSSFSSLPALQAVPVRILLAVLGVAAGIVLLWKWEKLSAPITFAVLIVLAPMLPLVIASFAWRIYIGPPAGRLPDKTPVASLPQEARAPHVLWFIFDEWDQALTFVRRPAGLQLPELDRFRSESFHGERAFPPARHTILSIPSLLTGKTFIDSKLGGLSELMLTYERNQPPERLTSESTVFSEAHSAGFNVGIVGFYLPYCRLFDTTSCEWHSAIGFLPVEWDYPLSFGRYMVLAAKRQALNIPLVQRLGVSRALGLGEDSLGKNSYVSPLLHAVTYRRTREAALRSIIDPRLSLVYIHWNIPHMPAIYNAAKDDFSNGPPNAYWDNLRLVDRTVRDIRLTLEKAGVWDNSTILMTSDHPLRLTKWWNSALLDPLAGNTQGAEVPFLLKMAEEKQGFAYNAAMQTVVTKDLLLAILKGEITQPEQVAAWLDHNPPRR